MGPLEGVRVVEMAGLAPAPYAGMILADFGAEVIRVDRSSTAGSRFDPTRDYLARGKRSVGINMKDSRGLDVLLTSQTRVIRAALPHLRKSDAGRIVNIASTEAWGATKYGSPYTAAKHGVAGLTKSLAVELGREGITVNCICPGPINTGMTAPIPEVNLWLSVFGVDDSEADALQGRWDEMLAGLFAGERVS